MEAIMRTNTTNIELQSKLIELAKRQQDMLLKQQEQIARLEEKVAALEERIAICESTKEPVANEEEESIGYYCDMWKIDRACNHVNIDNPIADMKDLPITELTNDDIDHLNTIVQLMCALDRLHEYGDILIEAIIELNTILSEVERRSRTILI
jgi:hypothetical protein